MLMKYYGLHITFILLILLITFCSVTFLPTLIALCTPFFLALFLFGIIYTSSYCIILLN